MTTTNAPAQAAQPAAPGPRTIGAADKPVRAIAFSSGGFDTVMQLGVIQALLVIQGKAPDATVGVSAGAVSAAALAEVFQAAPDPEPLDQLRVVQQRSRQNLERNLASEHEWRSQFATEHARILSQAGATVGGSGEGASRRRRSSASTWRSIRSDSSREKCLVSGSTTIDSSS